MAESVATRSEILVLLSEAARRGHVPAMRLLLDELRYDEEARGTTSSVIDELASRRGNALPTV